VEPPPPPSLEQLPASSPSTANAGLRASQRVGESENIGKGNGKLKIKLVPG
jgi:hypothetical protein